jgi:hypothetical protein
VDYLIGNSDKMSFDKKLMQRLEDIENLPAEEKDKVYYLIDMALAQQDQKGYGALKKPSHRYKGSLFLHYRISPSYKLELALY